MDDTLYQSSAQCRRLYPEGGTILSTQTMTAIVPGALEKGAVPFTVYSSNQENQIVTFCQAGQKISEKQLKLLTREDKMFFISSNDLNLYLDYTFDRISNILKSVIIAIDDKASLLQQVGKRIVHRLFEDPRSGAVAQSALYVESFIDLILNSHVALKNLLTISTSASFALTHSINVCTFCLLLGEKLYGHDRKVLWLLGIGGLLLDIGMIVLNRNVLDRQGPMQNDEIEQMKQHTLRSRELMKQYGLPEEVLIMGQDHHERADGSGYPNGLKLQQIHPYARIAAVADVYDAMTSERSYHKKMSYDEAISQLAADRHLYDQNVLTELFRIVLHDEDKVRELLETE